MIQPPNPPTSSEREGVEKYHLRERVNILFLIFEENFFIDIKNTNSSAKATSHTLRHRFLESCSPKNFLGNVACFGGYTIP